MFFNLPSLFVVLRGLGCFRFQFYAEACFPLIWTSLDTTNATWSTKMVVTPRYIIQV